MQNEVLSGALCAVLLGLQGLVDMHGYALVSLEHIISLK
jgi:hypothetical protein